MFGQKAALANGGLSQVYVVFDRAAEQCGGMFECENDAVAARYYRRGMSEIPKSEWDDFKLIKIGRFDHKSLELVPLKEKEYIEVPYLEEVKE